MCRNIKRLRQPDRPPTDAELEAAALQFVRKISGYRVPSRGNRKAFDRAVHDVAAASGRLFDSLQIPARRHSV
jgi:hypothetical protein